MVKLVGRPTADHSHSKYLPHILPKSPVARDIVSDYLPEDLNGEVGKIIGAHY
jgi:hypothetical protein